MSKWKPVQDERPSRLVDFILFLAIVGGLGYLGYTHPDEVQSLKSLVGLGGPAHGPTQMASLPAKEPEPTSTTVAPSTTTNDVATPSVPIVGHPRMAFPAEDHWTWTTTDGKVYHEVKIEKITGDTVTILHAEGGARIPIANLPGDLQKELNYYTP